MMATKRTKPKYAWVRVPAGQDGSIPEPVKVALRERLARHVAANYAESCREVVVRFKGAYAYIDAFPMRQDYSPGASAEERAEIDATPVHLCRIQYLGDPDRWAFAFYKYSTETYAKSFTCSNKLEDTPEAAFDTASMYL